MKNVSHAVLEPLACNIWWQTSDREEEFQSGSPSRAGWRKAPSAEAARFLMPMGTSNCLNFLLLFSQPARPPWGPNLVQNWPLLCRGSLCAYGMCSTLRIRMIPGSFSNSQQTLQKAKMCIDQKNACKPSSCLSGELTAMNRIQRLCHVIYMSEFCFLGQDLEDCFQIGVSSLAADLGS